MCAQFVGSIADCLKNEMAERVLNSRYLAVMFDSATDCSVQETEAVVVRYVRNGHPVNELLALASLKHAHADGIIDAITTSFASIGHDSFKEHMVAFCADGASVNHGARGGVKAKLSNECPWLLGIWCLPHRLELAVMGMLKTSVMSGKVMRVLDLLHKTYHNSCKSKRELRELADHLGVHVRNPTRATGTRWTPHLERAVAILLKGETNLTTPGQYAILLQHSQHLAASNKNADIRGRSVFVSKLMVRFDFVLFCHVLLDLLSCISKLSVSLQGDPVILPSAVAAIQTCITNVKALKVIPGKHLKAFLQSTHSQREHGNDQITFQGVNLTDVPDMDPDNLSSLPSSDTQAISNAVMSTVQGMQDRFAVLLGTSECTGEPTDSTVVSCMKIFNHDTWPADVTETTYGDKEINVLLKWFESRLARQGCCLDAVPHQWSLFKNLVKHCFMDKSYLELMRVMMNKEPYKTNFKDLLHLIEILLVLPISSACCERIFSSQKRIKCDTRSSLHVDTVEDLIRISATGPSLEEFQPNPVVKKWLALSQRKRRPCYKEWPCQLDTFSDEDE